MSRPKVSICVPVYNVEKYIGRCIESLLNQTMSDIEIIVVNDCTPDSSMQIISSYAEKDNRIKIVNHEKNRGLMRARQTGYLAAKGDYVTFCDSDDSLPVDALETLYNTAIETKADIVSGDMTYITVNNMQTPMSFSLRYGNDKESIYHSLLTREYGHNLCSKLFSRSLFENKSYETYDNFINGEDGCLFYQIVSQTTNAVHISKPVYNYYQNVESSSNVRLKESAIKSILKVNSMKVKTVSPYPRLQRLLNRNVCGIIVDLYYAGYSKDVDLSQLIKSEGLRYYSSFSTILGTLNIRLITKYIIGHSNIWVSHNS